MMQDHARLQCYMDDPLLIIMGDQRTRDSVVSRLLYTARIFGVNLAYEKGERGSKVCWIGVTIEVNQEGEEIIVGIPQKLIDEITQKLTSWSGMVSLRELKSTTGKLSWLAGTLPRTRWAVAMLYGALADAEREEKEDLEGKRAARRANDQRPKRGLVAVKRVELARRWLLAYLAQDEAWRSWHVPMAPVPLKWSITTDASPYGVGAILAVVDKDMEELTPTVAFRGKITRNVAQTLGIPFHEAAGQAVLEAWTVLLAIRYWKSTVKGGRLLIKSDSTVALALAKRLSSSTPVLNWVGGEMTILLGHLQMGELVTHHLPGKLNVEADYLSRPDLTGPPPGRIQDVSIRQVNEAWMLESTLPPPGVEPSLWGRTPPVSAVFDCI